MDRNRKAGREGDEITFRYRSRNEDLLDEELIEGRMTQLVAVIAEMQHAAVGSVRLERRSRWCGACERVADDSTVEFYAKLRPWIESDLPRSKLPASAKTEGYSGNLAGKRSILRGFATPS